MMQRVLATSLIASALVVSAGSARAQNVWAFGDSLSDNGNLSLLFASDGVDTTYLPAQAYKPFFPAQLGGTVPLQRISTGKTATEYIAEFYGAELLPSGLESQIGPEAANNFAVFGARASLTGQLDLPYQVAQLAGRVDAGLDVSSDRAIVFIGGNDVLAAWGAAIEPIGAGGSLDLETGEAILDEALASLHAYLLGDGGSVQLGDGSEANVPSLTALGLNRFIVLNVPGIQDTPLVGQTGQALGHPKEVTWAARRLTHYFNRGLCRLVREMKAAGLDVVAVPVDRIVRKVRRKFEALGFKNATDDCYLTDTVATLIDGVPPTPGEFRESCGPDETEQFMFIDTAHPTGAVHRALADRILDYLPCP